MALHNSFLPVAQDSTQAMPPAAARDLTNTDLQRIPHSLDHSVSDNTQAMYTSAWNGFQGVKGGGIVDHCGGRKVYHLA